MKFCTKNHQWNTECIEFLKKACKYVFNDTSLYSFLTGQTYRLTKLLNLTTFESRQIDNMEGGLWVLTQSWETKNCLVWDFHFQFKKELQFRISQRNWVEVDSGKKRHGLMIQSNWSIFQNDFIHKRMTGNIECVFCIKSNPRRCDIV